MRNKFIPIFLLAVLSFCNVKSQSYIKNLLAFSWQTATPASNTDFLSKTSYTGFKIEYRYFIKKNLSVGAFIDWNSNSEYFPTATYQNKDQTQAVTTDMYRFIYTFPMGLNGHYYFTGSKMLRPFVGLALGAQYSEQNMYYNIYETTNKNWGFLARPELGVIVTPFSTHSVGILVGTSYAYATNKNDDLKFSSMAHVNFQLGIVFQQ
jgi:hypothetical protein